MLREISVDGRLGLEDVIVKPLLDAIYQIRNRDGVHDFGSKSLEVRNRLIHYCLDLLVIIRRGVGLRIEWFTNNPKSRASQSVLIEKGRRCGRDLSGGISCYRIILIVARNHVEQQSRVLDGACNRSQRVLARCCRHHPEPAYQRDGRPKTDEAVEGGGTADGPAGVLPDSDGRKVGGNAGAGSAGGAGRAT